MLRKYIRCILALHLLLVANSQIQSCKDGIRHPNLNVPVCCSSSCGALCGSINCGDGGADICCGSKIMNSNRSCTDFNAPCTLNVGTGFDPQFPQSGVINRSCAALGGILATDGESCCPSSCGSCGGYLCNMRPGGAAACCSGSIQSSGKSCDNYSPPCIQSKAATSQPTNDPVDPTDPGSLCKRLGGILNVSGEYCCSAQCGTCGGYGCQNRPGGASSCCTSAIKSSAVSCRSANAKAPCIMDAPASGPAPTSAGENVPNTLNPCSSYSGIVSTDGKVCCSATCGTCGGSGCDKRPGGYQNCCTGAISSSSKSCGDYNAPCVMGANNDISTPIPPLPSDPFQITLIDMDSGASSRYADYFSNAAKRWESIITTGVEDAAGRQYSWFSSYYNFRDAVDDLVIGYSIRVIDGLYGTLGRAGPTYVRPSGPNAGIPVSGIMIFDQEDVDMLIKSDNFYNVILHEMGHVLGIGTRWPTTQNCAISCDTYNERESYPGACIASLRFNELGLFGELRVESDGTKGDGTYCAHWSESQLGNELMTGYLNSGKVNPLSIITIGALEDVGYKVDYSTADDYNMSTIRWGNVTAPDYSVIDMKSGMLAVLPEPAYE